MAAVVSNKRKRESQDMQALRPGPGIGASGDFEGYLQAQHDNGMDSNDHGLDFASMLAQHEENNSAAVSEQHPQTHVSDQQHRPSQSGPQQHQEGQAASDTATAALAQYHTMTVPQPTEHAFLAQQGEGEHRGSVDQGSGGEMQRTTSFSDFPGGEMKDAQGNAGPNGSSSPPLANSSAPKPAVGSDEWHKVRRDNHKEVERRRRETINEGINELAKIVPGCEKNKGSILARAVQFITQLKENETQNIEKWTLEKLLTEQAIAELSSSCDKLKAECQRAWAEGERWKKAAQKAGVANLGEGDDKAAHEDTGVE